MTCYNLDEIMTNLKKEITVYRARLAAWEAVTFPTKKNGEPFAVMSKNISGATYKAESYTMQPGEMVLTVTAWEKEMGCGYVSSEIKAYGLVKYMTNGKPESKPQNLQPKQPYLEQIYIYDLEDIKEAVAEKIAQLKNEISQYEKQLEAAPAAFREYREAFGAAMKQLEESTGKTENSTLFYMIRDTVQARYPYC